MSKSKMRHASDLGISFSAYKIVFDRGYSEAIEDYGWSNETPKQAKHLWKLANELEAKIQEEK